MFVKKIILEMDSGDKVEVEPTNVGLVNRIVDGMTIACLTWIPAQLGLIPFRGVMATQSLPVAQPPAAAPASPQTGE